MSARYKLAFTRLLQGGGFEYEFQKENFRRYLVKVFADECFDFWNQIQTMEDFTDPTEISVTARKIWDTFVTPGAPRLVNLSGDIVSDCVGCLSDPFPNMFRNAKKEIFNLMFVNYGYEFIEREGLLEKLTNENKPGVKSQSSEEDMLRLSWATPQDNFQEDIPTSTPHFDAPIEVSSNWRKIITPRWFKANTGTTVPLSGNSSPRNEMILSNTEFIKPSLAMTKSIKSNDSIFDQYSRDTVSPLTTRDRNDSGDTENNESFFTRGRSSSSKKSRKSTERKSPKPNTRAIKARTSKKKPKSEPTTPDVLRKNDIHNNNNKPITPDGLRKNDINNNHTEKTEPEKENLYNNIPKKLSNSCGRVNSEPFRPSRKKTSLEILSQSEINTTSTNHFNRRRAFSSRRPLRHSSYSISAENQNKQK